MTEGFYGGLPRMDSDVEIDSSPPPSHLGAAMDDTDDHETTGLSYSTRDLEHQHGESEPGITLSCYQSSVASSSSSPSPVRRHPAPRHQFDAQRSLIPPHFPLYGASYSVNSGVLGRSSVSLLSSASRPGVLSIAASHSNSQPSLGSDTLRRRASATLLEVSSSGRVSPFLEPLPIAGSARCMTALESNPEDPLTEPYGASNVPELVLPNSLDSKRNASIRSKGRWQSAFRKIQMNNAFKIGNRRMLRQTIEADDVPILAAHHTDKSSVLLVAYSDGTINKYNASSARLISEIAFFIGQTECTQIAFDARGDRVAMCLASGCIQVHDLAEPVHPTVLIESENLGSVRCLAWSRCSRKLAVGTTEHGARLFCMVTGNELAKFTAHHDAVVAVGFSFSGKYLATGCKDRNLRIFDLDSNTKLISLQFDRVYSVAFSPNGQYLAVGCDDKHLRLIEMKTRTVRYSVRTHTDYVRSVAFSADGQKVATGSKDGSVCILDTESGEPLLEIKLGKPISIIAQAASGLQWVFGTFGSRIGHTHAVHIINALNVASAEDILSIQAHTSPIRCLAFSPDSLWIASGSANKEVKVFDIAGNVVHCVMRDHRKEITDLTFSPCGNVLASASKDKTVRLFSCQQAGYVFDARIIFRSDTVVNTVTFADFGTLLLLGCQDGKLRVIDLANEMLTHNFPLHTEPINAVAIHEYGDGKTLVAIGSHDHTISLLDLSSSILLTTITGHSKPVFCLAFSFDGAFFASGSRDKSVRIYDAATGQAVRIIEGAHADHVKALAFTAVGNLVSGSVNGELRTYEGGGTFPTDGFGSRVRMLGSGIGVIVTAPPKSRYAELAAVSTADGTIHFVDLSWCQQQPTYVEAVKIIAEQRLKGRLDIVNSMVERFPLVVHSEDAHGNTLFHYATARGDEDLLATLLRARLPRFWLKTNRSGLDMLGIAVGVRSRMCVKQILDKIIASKQEGKLASFPVEDDRFLRTLVQMTADFHDLVAEFLSALDFDDAELSVGFGCTQLQMRPGQINIAGSQYFAPARLWAGLRAQGKLKIDRNRTGTTSRVQPYVISIPNCAGLMRIDRNIATLTDMKKQGSRKRKMTMINFSGTGALNVQNSLLHAFVHCGNARLFGNKVMRSVLEYKWRMYARRMFLHELALFCASLILFVIFSFSIIHLEDAETIQDLLKTEKGIGSVIVALLLPLFSIRSIVREIHHQSSRRSLGRVRNIWSVMHLSGGLLNILSVALHLSRQRRSLIGVASLTAFFMWMQLFYYLRGFEYTGGLIRMVVNVFIYTGPYLLILFIVLLGCANSFMLLFANMGQNHVENPSSFTGKDSPLDTLFVTFFLLILGDIEVTVGQLNHGRHVVLAKITFVLFTLMVTIFMLNLMINLMDDFMQKINDEEGDAFPYEKARIIAELELSLSQEQLESTRYFPLWLHVLKPQGAFGDGLSSTWQGTVKAIKTENEILQQHTSTTLGKISAHMNAELKAVELRMEERLHQDITDLKVTLREKDATLLQMLHQHLQEVNSVMQGDLSTSLRPGYADDDDEERRQTAV